ncbi:carboxypeptidase regulatory-like domain-containing protein [Planctomicrobium sp. SH664]|uniref:carboxypeptidase regulatory-like domain-containing protein n=1 Tax=Planctomicrobium sp. SH664 TaxID=3448125 RepID=UPI003F5C27E5
MDLGRVYGKVTLDGQPLPEAAVIFVPTGPGRSARGRTDGQGYYELQYSATSTGALVGPVSVEIRLGTPEIRETLPAKYHNKTVLKEEVKPGKNEINFDLQSK